MDAQTERERIVDELATLPAGTIVTKHINGRDQPYLQWREGNRVRSRYLKAAEREKVVQQVERRKELVARLKELDAAKDMQSEPRAFTSDLFETTVRTGKSLQERAERVAAWQRRDSYSVLQRYLAHGPADRVCIISGLRRTGKTTMMRQAIADMSPTDQARTAYIEVLAGDTLSALRGLWVRLHR